MLSQFYSRLCCQVRPNYPIPYRFEFNNNQMLTNMQIFQSNQIKTTKYNAFNFIPKSIIMQYKRLANLYFLIVATISTIPNVTPLNPGLIWAPMVFVLIISIAKQSYEDYNRYKTDRLVNDQYETQVSRRGRIQKIKWKDVVVGDICRIKDQQTFPADLILISSSDKDGVAKIQTASLDGEQTLKSRYAFSSLNKIYRDENIGQLQGTFEGEIPSFSLFHFRGTLQIGSQKIVMTDNSQLLFRGAKLKNTEWAWGLVVYTGQCSKIMMNGQNYSTKLSNVQRKLNYLLLIMLIIQIGLCLFVASLSVQKHFSMIQTQNYILWPQNYNRTQVFIMNFLLFFIEFSSSIPVSLIVTIEIAKTVQSYFIDFDQLMYSSWRKKKVYARIASLNQQLGQVQYLFTDKTGTLTKNLLKFHTAIIGDKTYQFQYDTQKKIYRNQNMWNVLQRLKRTHSYESQSSNQQKDDNNSYRLNNHSQLANLYLLCLLFCNNVSTIENQQQEIVYQSQSPDQIALINLAKDYHYQLIKRNKNSIKVKINDVYYDVEVVTRFQFTSDRKRMSIIVKWNGEYLLFIKGADNIIFQRSLRSRFNITQQIDDLSKSGLRSLLIAFRVIDSQDVSKFIKDIDSASMAMRQQIRETYQDIFENDLNIIGASGLLDELQDGVPQTLCDLQRAGIRVWMLTGDKLQTSYQVGKSCNLIKPQYQVILMRNNNTPIHDLISESKRSMNSTKKYSLIIEGSVLMRIFNSQVQEEFTQFTLFFSSVICCRMLPVQKSQVVNMVKRHLSKICVAVGDGGNDVSMIKQASIGIGLYGQQGMSAVQASDYAIPQFRMIWRLLFVHGRWNYNRVSQMILYFVYKSVIFTVPRFLFSFYNAYSGYPIYDDYYIALYNVVFTALPLLIRALFEQDFNYIVKKPENIIDDQVQPVKSQLVEQTRYLPKGYRIHQGFRKLFPKIYFVGQKNICFNLRQCFLWIFQAVILGACLLFIVMKTLGKPYLNQQGQNSNLFVISITVYTGVIIIDTIKLCMQVKHWTKLLFFSIVFLSIVPYLGFMWVMNYYFLRPLERVLLMSYTSARAYISILFFILVSMGLNGLMVYYRFHQHKILMKMSFAVAQDHQMIEYLSNKNVGHLSQQSAFIIKKQSAGSQIS